MGTEQIQAIKKSSANSNVNKTVQYANVIFDKQKNKTISFYYKTPEEVAKAIGLTPNFVKRVMNEEHLELKKYNLHGVNLIGYGHNIDSDKNYNYGSTITPEQANTLLAKDLNASKTDIEKMTAGIKLTTGQKEALMDMSFNIGSGNLQKSNLIKMIQSGKVDEAVKEFDMINADNKVNVKLCFRRIQDIYDYSKHKPTKSTVSAMQTILDEAEIAYAEKIMNTKIPLQYDLINKKALYFKKSYQLFEEIKNKVNTTKTIPKKPQNNFLLLKSK